jgi:hypothetical protein
MGGESVMLRVEKCIHNFGVETWRKETTRKKDGVDGRIIVNLTLRIGPSGGLS